MDEETIDMVGLANAECALPELTVGALVGEYTVVRKLGAGILGTTWAVQDAAGAEQVLELLREDYVLELDAPKVVGRARRMREALPAGILVPLDAGEHEEHPYLVTEAPAGESLRTLLDATPGGWPAPRIRSVFLPLLDLLRQTHSKVRHSGLSGENIFIGADGAVAISQLAMYELAEDDIFGGEGLPRAGAPYLAPELEQYSSRADATVDVYAVGVLLYEALCGVPPVGRYELPSTLRKDVPAGLDDVIELALAGSPYERFQSADDLAMAIEHAFASDGRKEDKALNARPLMLVLVVLLAIVVAVGVAMRPEPAEDLLSAELERRTSLRAEVAARPAPTETRSEAPSGGMAWVSGGPYIAGRFAANDPLAGASERAEQVIDVAGFWIDVAPMQVPDEATGGFKIVKGMTQDEARRICAKFNKRLCTEDEWEKACKGPDSAIYTYGDTFDAERCPAPGFSTSYQTNDFPDCVSGYGVLGMSGGVGEWTATERGGVPIIKPAMVGSGPTYTRCAGQAGLEEGRLDRNVGMRCCGP